MINDNLQTLSLDNRKTIYLFINSLRLDEHTLAQPEWPVCEYENLILMLILILSI